MTAVDSGRCAHVLARCYVATDAADPGLEREAPDAVAGSMPLPGRPGYVTATFCRAGPVLPSRKRRPDRCGAGRDRAEYAGSALWPVLLTSLLEAADRVDSTTGLQMAYLKEWARVRTIGSSCGCPHCCPGPGRALLGDACRLAGSAALGDVDLAYLDPPYNQHRYDANYHVWETIVAWDAPDHYGVACKRVDLRDPATRSAFNGRRTMASALARVVVGGSRRGGRALLQQRGLAQLRRAP